MVVPCAMLFNVFRSFKSGVDVFAEVFFADLIVKA